MGTILSRPRFRRYGDPQYEAIRVGRVDKSRGEAPFLFTTGPWRGQTVWVEPSKMQRYLSVASRYLACVACRQMIHPGELYCDQRWAPWECHPDSDKVWFCQPACRFCTVGYWKDADDGWWEQDAQEWADTQAERWLEEAGVDHLEPPGPPGFFFGRQIREEFSEPLDTAQKQASAFLAFLRRFGKGAKPATLRRVGPALLAIGFQRPPEGGLDHMLSTSGLPGEEWWRCDGCQQHPCDCTCPMSDLAPWQAEVTL